MCIVRGNDPPSLLLITDLFTVCKYLRISRIYEYICIFFIFNIYRDVYLEIRNEEFKFKKKHRKKNKQY